MLIFKEEEIKQQVTINRETIAVVEDAFTDLATKPVEMPPIMRVDIPENNGEVDVKTAYIPGHELFALKVSSGFFNNYKLGLPSANGLMMLISAVTGEPKALLLDNGYLTDVRTAAAGAVAAKYMANESITTVGVIGAGAQARYQLKALREVRSFQHVLVYGPTEKRVLEFKEEMEESLGVNVYIADTPKQVVCDSDIVVTTTPATEPVIKREWLHPGLHITAMGSDAEHKQELEASILKVADHYVADVKKQVSRLGELRSAIEEGLFSERDSIVELGDLTSNKTPIRTSEKDITVADLTGTGGQDTAIALYAYNRLTKTAQLG
ncbi:cyclodeaminase [Ornithinibacillus halophilus]|uniref:Ornithine cyclodeaminase n=1 Tax=Ornithinibacillus halophilus TaxID=930117 RepID=A0A1M5MJJ3_9BACI|nr:cyclodeaminase [Ornithinibacillus halophilus]SHG77411.1 ornithine cyclodeaminase [Ornithinibacillus halophilus]